MSILDGYGSYSWPHKKFYTMRRFCVWLMLENIRPKRNDTPRREDGTPIFTSHVSGKPANA